MCGELLKGFEIPCHLEQAFCAGWKEHWRLVKTYIQKVTSGESLDLEILHFLHAALNCLDFHTLYQKYARISPSSPHMEIAWQLVFRDIISQIDSNLAQGGLLQPGTRDLTDGDLMPVTRQIVVGEPSIVMEVLPAKVPLATTVVLNTLKGEVLFPNTGSIMAQQEVALFDREDVMKGSM